VDRTHAALTNASRGLGRERELPERLAGASPAPNHAELRDRVATPWMNGAHVELNEVRLERHGRLGEKAPTGTAAIPDVPSVLETVKAHSRR